MVYVRMGEKNVINVCGRIRYPAVFVDIGALLHSAVDKDLFSAYLKQCAGAGHFMCRTEKCDFHYDFKPFGNLLKDSAVLWYRDNYITIGGNYQYKISLMKTNLSRTGFYVCTGQDSRIKLCFRFRICIRCS